MTEAELQAAVIDLAHVYGWKVAHFRPAKTEKGWRTPVAADGKGFPDLLMIRDADLLAIELKADKGRPTREQEEWLEALYPVCLESCVWTPRDWPEPIHSILKGESR